MSAFLVDTNVLVYAYDPRDRKKQQHARAILDRLVSRELAVVSVQCLTEFLFRIGDNVFIAGEAKPLEWHRIYFYNSSSFTLSPCLPLTSSK